MNKIDEINRKRKEANARLARLDSKVYRAFLEMEKATVNARFALEVMEHAFEKGQA